MALMSLRFPAVTTSDNTATPTNCCKEPSLGKKTSVSILDTLAYKSSSGQPSATPSSAKNNGFSNPSDDEEINPIGFLEQLFARHGVRLSGRRSTAHLHQRQNVRQPCPTEVDAYDIETTSAVRDGNLQALRELHLKGYSLNASNRYGESLLHMCCRRGATKIVEFMLLEAKVNPRVLDDMGRTAFHDAMWSSTPNFATMDVLLKVLPPVGLLIQDARGHTPFHYAPRKHWGLWVQYLQEREGMIVQWIVARKQLAADHKIRQSQAHHQRFLQQKLPKSNNVLSPSSSKLNTSLLAVTLAKSA